MSRTALIVTIATLTVLGATAPSHADPADEWWDEGWPYRVPVTVSGGGVGGASIDFTAAFNALGLPGALLDVRSIRVVPYTGTVAGAPVSHQETYSASLDDADNPQIGWSGSGVFWTVNDGSASADSTRFTQGTGSLKAIVQNLPGGYGYPGVELHIAAGDPKTDWSRFESFLYDVWPEVNASAVDQAPDLYWFKLYNTTGCPSGNVTEGGPPLALDRWNRVSVPLDPLDDCTTPSLGDIQRMEFHTRDNDTVNGNSGLWDDGDVLTMWFDDVRLVDQDGGGMVKWSAPGAGRYYVYFDRLDHEGHAPPTTTTLGAVTAPGSASAIESGGYLHRVTGASAGSLGIWSVPAVEKVRRGEIVPAATAPLRVEAAGDEFEPFQLVVRSPTAQSLAVSISSFTKGADVIPASAVTLHRVDYVTLTRLSDHFGRLGPWPDPLYPVAMGSAVAFPAGQDQPLWFTLHVPRGQAPGVYAATVSIGSATIPVSLLVWGFDLPRDIHLAGEWGFGWSNVVEDWKGTIGGSVQPCYWTLVDALYEDFADHRLTPKGVGWPAGLNYPGGVEYDCSGNLAPDAWGDWDFHTLAQKYLDGGELRNGVGFPSFQILGPASNWPPDSRPSSFCGQSRGTDPPGSGGYNQKWLQYWSAVDGYTSTTSTHAQKGYYHIVNEPQTSGDYDIVAYLSSITKGAAPNTRILVSEQVESSIYQNATYPGAKIDIWMPTISNYEVVKSQDRQANHGEDVWWYFLYGDRPPLPNPTVIDRVGLEARITPWLAWLERVGGLVYYSTTDWSTDPWSQPWFNDGNGDGFLFYPAKDGTIAFDACSAQSNRLVPSIRWELLREGMEDYEYLWLLNGGDPVIGVANAADAVAQTFIASRTLYSRVPTDLAAARRQIAQSLGASCLTLSPATLPGGTVGQGYSQNITASGGNPPYTFTVTAGALPVGLSLTSGGVLAGTPTLAATFGFTVTATDGTGCAGTQGYSVTIAGTGSPGNVIAGLGLGQPNSNRVKVHRQDGSATPVDFFAYGAGAWGVNVASGDVGGAATERILTGPGPGDVYGPQVRAFASDGSPLGKINFYAYGTLRYGVNADAAPVDGDAFDEIVSGAGSGAVFGPHVRGWNFDGVALGAIAKINFFAYGTLKWGVEVGGGDVDGDGFGELLTGPGPGVVFGPQVRGFNYDGATLGAIAKINFNAFATPEYGANVAGGDVDGDGFGEIAAAPGPGAGATFPPRFAGFDYDGGPLSSLAGFDVTLPTAATYGGRVGLGEITGDGTAELLAGAGRDPVADATVRPYAYTGSALVPLVSFTPFNGTVYGVNVDAGMLGY